MDAPEIHAPHAHGGTGRRWLDLLVGWSALGVSLLSIVLAIKHGNTMEKLVEAQTWPHVRLDNSNTRDGRREISLVLRNAGSGPAKIQSVWATYQGKPVRSWPELLGACCSTVPGATVPQLVAQTDGALVSGGPEGVVLLPGDAQLMLQLPLTPRNDTLWRRLDTERFQLKVTVCYCSVFDECYLAQTGVRDHPHVARCEERADEWKG